MTKYVAKRSEGKVRKTELFEVGLTKKEAEVYCQLCRQLNLTKTQLLEKCIQEAIAWFPI